MRYTLIVLLCLVLSSCNAVPGLLTGLGGNAVADIAGEVPDALNEVQEIVDELTPDGPNQRVRTGDNSSVEVSIRPVARPSGPVVDGNNGNVVSDGNTIDKVEGDVNQTFNQGVPWYYWVISFLAFLIALELPRTSDLYKRWKGHKESKKIQFYHRDKYDALKKKKTL